MHPTLSEQNFDGEMPEGKCAKSNILVAGDECVVNCLTEMREYNISSLLGRNPSFWVSLTLLL